MLYNISFMSTVYLLTAALAFVPILSQIVGTALIIKAFALARQPKEARSLPLWLPLTFGVIALLFMIWHTIHTVNVFSPSYNAPDSETKVLLGVNVPLEVADRVQDVVSAIPFTLLSVFFIGGCIWVLFMPDRVLVKATAPVWVLRLLALICLVYFVWTAWGSWRNMIANVQALI